jgi:hypothetical protein
LDLEAIPNEAEFLGRREVEAVASLCVVPTTDLAAVRSIVEDSMDMVV